MIQLILRKLRLHRQRLIAAMLSTLGLLQLVQPVSAKQEVDGPSGRVALEARVAAVRSALQQAGAQAAPDAAAAAKPADELAQWRNWPNWGNWNNWNNWANWGNWFNR